jgi:hypothetical protein
MGLLATLSVGAESYTPELLQAPLLATLQELILLGVIPFLRQSTKAKPYSLRQVLTRELSSTSQ